MYYFIVGSFLLVLPLVSCAIELTRGDHASALTIAMKWFVFWGVGIRLLTAGMRQIIQPRYTAETILGLDLSHGDDPLLLVRELGFGNVAIGVVGTGSIIATGWVLAAAVAGAIFYGFAGVNHTRQPHRTRLENVAMISDLLFALVLISLIAAKVAA